MRKTIFPTWIAVRVWHDDDLELLLGVGDLCPVVGDDPALLPGAAVWVVEWDGVVHVSHSENCLVTSAFNIES